MRLASILANVILSLCITVSGVLFLLRTYTNAEYLQSSAKTAGVYKNVEQIVSGRLVELHAKNSQATTLDAEAAIEAVVTPVYIESKTQETTDQIKQVLRGEREKIIVDFSDLAKDLNNQGVVINSTDLKPLEVTAPENIDTSIIRGAQNLELLQFISFVLAVAAFAISALLAMVRRSSAGTGVAFLVCAIIFGTFSLFLHLLKPVAKGVLNVPSSITEITPSVEGLTKIILSDSSRLLLQYAVISILLSLFCFIIHKFLLQKSVQPSKPPAHNTVRKSA